MKNEKGKKGDLGLEPIGVQNLLHDHDDQPDFQDEDVDNNNNEDGNNNNNSSNNNNNNANVTCHDAPSEIVVEGGGQPAANGTYVRDGYFSSASKCSMRGNINGDSCAFSLLKCNVSNNTQHWYISIVPRNGQPGTSTDIDFYSAPVLDSCAEYPPPETWMKSNEGLDPPPKLIYKNYPSPGVVEEISFMGTDQAL